MLVVIIVLLLTNTLVVTQTNAVDGSYNKRTQNSLDNSKVKQSNEAEVCLPRSTAHHLLLECPVYQNVSVDERWEVVEQNNCCQKMFTDSPYKLG